MSVGVHNGTISNDEKYVYLSTQTVFHNKEHLSKIIVPVVL